jgi:modulator of FtsH protease
MPFGRKPGIGNEFRQPCSRKAIEPVKIQSARKLPGVLPVRTFPAIFESPTTVSKAVSGVAMNDFRPSPFNRTGPLAGAPGEVVRNRVLRNTYWLLALSMIPTVLGAAIGLYTGFNRTMGASPGLSAMIFLVGAFGLMFAIQKNKENSLGVILLLVFTFFMGLMLSRLLGFVLGMGNGPQLVMTAFGGTAVVFATMATIASTTKRDFSGLQKFLFMGVVVILLAGIANIFLQLPALMLTVSVLAVVIFSVFMLVDLQRVINGGETNYVTATLAIYLDVYNVFSNLLMLLGIFGGGNRN